MNTRLIKRPELTNPKFLASLVLARAGACRGNDSSTKKYVFLQYQRIRYLLDNGNGSKFRKVAKTYKDMMDVCPCGNDEYSPDAFAANYSEYMLRDIIKNPNSYTRAGITEALETVGTYMDQYRFNEFNFKKLLEVLPELFKAIVTAKFKDGRAPKELIKQLYSISQLISAVSEKLRDKKSIFGAISVLEFILAKFTEEQISKELPGVNIPRKIDFLHSKIGRQPRLFE